MKHHQSHRPSKGGFGISFPKARARKRRHPTPVIATVNSLVDVDDTNPKDAGPKTGFAGSHIQTKGRFRKTTELKVNSS